MKASQHPLLPRQHLLPSNDSGTALTLFAQESKALVEVLSNNFWLSLATVWAFIHTVRTGATMTMTNAFFSHSCIAQLGTSMRLLGPPRRIGHGNEAVG